jgi:hypothetical protein
VPKQTGGQEVPGSNPGAPIVRKWLQNVRFRLARRKQQTVESVPESRQDDSALLGVLVEQPALPLVAEQLLVERARRQRLGEGRGSGARDYGA